MEDCKVPHLCGGILFALILEARKIRKSKRNRNNSGTDGLSMVDVYCGLIYVLTGDKMDKYQGDTLAKAATQYRSCTLSKGAFVPFTDKTNRDTFIDLYKNKREKIYTRIKEFTENYLSEGKCEWLTRAIIEILIKDEEVDVEEKIEIDDKKSVKISNLMTIKNINFYVFIGSIFSYVLSNCPDCESGRGTFEAWFSRENNRQEWKFNSDIGNSIQHINIIFTIPEFYGVQKSNIEENGDELVSENHIENSNVKKITEEDDEDILLKARSFCMQYENELSLLPLCEIAYNIDPLHKDVRKIYTDYKLCNSKVKRKILELKEIPEFDFSDETWKSKCLLKYNRQVFDDGLTTKEFLYEGAKYFHRAYEHYSNYEIEEFDPRIFERPFKDARISEKLGNCTSLSFYIDDYYWYRKENPEHYVKPPMDYLWDLCDLGGCQENVMTFWVCKFIIASSYKMVEDGTLVDEKWLNVSISDDLIHTQEDMYYYALLQLYWLYMVKRK